MKNMPEAGSSLFRKKGFFIALYSCLGVVAVLALVVTVLNSPTTNDGTSIAYELEQTLPVGADQVDSYLAGLDEDAWFRPRQQPEQPPTPPPATEPPQQPQRPMTPPPTSPTLPPADPGTQPTGETAEPPTPEATPSPTPSPESTEETPLPTPQVATFAPFADGDRMIWPVYGETVMAFSTTALIYDPTLDQFRTNDNLRIAASEGDAVRAGADGRVLSVGRNVRQGNYVVIDHGNGWVATYGQLMENPLVAEGEIVRQGQVIGGVGQPSIFGTENGTHVHLRIEKDEVAINPYYVLVERGTQ